VAKILPFSPPGSLAEAGRRGTCADPAGSDPGRYCPTVTTAKGAQRRKDSGMRPETCYGRQLAVPLPSTDRRASVCGPPLSYLPQPDRARDGGNGRSQNVNRRRYFRGRDKLGPCATDTTTFRAAAGRAGDRWRDTRASRSVPEPSLPAEQRAPAEAVIIAAGRSRARAGHVDDGASSPEALRTWKLRAGRSDGGALRVSRVSTLVFSWTARLVERPPRNR